MKFKKIVSISAVAGIFVLSGCGGGNININEGDEVVIFGEDLPVQKLADWIGTIPYEILTNVSERVKRIYFEE